MRQAIGSASRFLAVLALVATAAVVAGLTPAAHSPYVSALSNVAAGGDLLAANTCHKVCSQAPRGLKFRCVDATTNASCRLINGGNDCAVGTC